VPRPFLWSWGPGPFYGLFLRSIGPWGSRRPSRK
jgi:hypothetical protein